MSEKKPNGRPSVLDDKMIADFSAAIKKVLVLRHAAGMCKIHIDTVYKWLTQAKNDFKENKTDTKHQKFFYALKDAQAEKVAECLDALNSRVPNWQANAWILERCFREDFGADAGVIQELLDNQNKLEGLLQRYLDNGKNVSA